MVLLVIAPPFAAYCEVLCLKVSKCSPGFCLNQSDIIKSHFLNAF